MIVIMDLWDDELESGKTKLEAVYSKLVEILGTDWDDLDKTQKKDFD